ncbi:hypothetical protein [Pseudoflavitalea rhizosphaerae]|uniref:hypothetical protein n=1 Tax=Pseudoflavitalea rhizosphaerae TaxID=1884793 RepID=UPI000F8DD7BD|nr:hypothetical protein [Pseudoflavitalea rhizosphaerae]
MKKSFFMAGLLFLSGWSLACDVCERQQPALLKGITHGAGAESRWDYLIVSLVMAIVAFTLYFSIKWLVRPGERSVQHIKRKILNY